MVGLLNRETGQYYLYVTNVPPEKLAAEDIGATYSLRWQGRGDTGAPRRTPLPRLQHAQERRLEREGDLGHVVEQERMLRRMAAMEALVPVSSGSVPALSSASSAPAEREYTTSVSPMRSTSP